MPFLDSYMLGNGVFSVMIILNKKSYAVYFFYSIIIDY